MTESLITVHKYYDSNYQDSPRDGLVLNIHPTFGASVSHAGQPGNAETAMERRIELPFAGALPPTDAEEATFLDEHDALIQRILAGYKLDFDMRTATEHGVLTEDAEAAVEALGVIVAETDFNDGKVDLDAWAWYGMNILDANDLVPAVFPRGDDGKIDFDALCEMAAKSEIEGACALIVHINMRHVEDSVKTALDDFVERGDLDEEDLGVGI
ncbi:hypothetical protein ABH922_001800 [Rhodococcus sp. 27YEA15]|uniref:hypothetical protein n=1 Tax=Rhodococcus sp. 27YEA15 TaxID=3156259 RepID=UPI003C79C232